MRCSTDIEVLKQIRQFIDRRRRSVDLGSQRVDESIGEELARIVPQILRVL